MKNIFKLTGLLGLLLCASCLCAQVDTEFWFAAPMMSDHHTGAAKFYLMFFAYEEDANITISQPANSNFEPQHYFIHANSFKDVLIADSKPTAKATIEVPYNEISKRGLLIQSDAKVGCYYQITAHNGEAYTLKGKNALGTDFFVSMQNKYNNHSFDGSEYSSVQIVATEDNTEVIITPNGQILLDDKTTCAENVITIHLNRGETYAFHACSRAAADHIVGTVIKANKPIAVTSNDDSVEVGSNQDAVGEQILPIDFAGTEYGVISQGSAWEGCFIIALYDNTTVTLSNDAVYTLQKGNVQFIPLSTTAGDPTAIYIKSDQPIQVFQLTGANTEAGGTVLPQMLCTGSKTVSYKRIPESTKVIINLLTKTQNISSFFLNGNEVDPVHFKLLDGTNGDWSYATIDVSSKPIGMPLQVSCETGVFQMGVIDFCSDGGQSCTYGFFSDYAQSTNIDIELEGEVIDSALAVCDGETLVLKALVASNVHNLTWYLPNGTIVNEDSLVMTDLTYRNSGLYKVTAESAECEVTPKTFYLTIPKRQETPLIEKVEICEGETYTWPLNGKTYSENGKDTVYFPLKVNDKILLGCDSAVVLDLTVHPITYGIDAVTSYVDYQWIDGNIYTESTNTPTWILTNSNGCDSIVTLNLTMAHCVEIAIQAPTEICGDETELLVPYTLASGIISVPQIQFDAAAVTAGFTNGTLNFTNQEFIVPIPENIYANTYSAKIIVPNSAYCDTVVYDFQFLIHYPSGVFVQKWNDVLAVYNDKYNRGFGNEGYVFTDFQWYKNGQPITGKTGSYLYVGTENPNLLDFASEYSVLLTRNDGTKIMSCSMQPEFKEVADAINVRLESNVVTPMDKIKLQTNYSGEAKIWDVMGNLIMTYPLIIGENSINSPDKTGIYVVNVKINNGDEKIYRIVVK